MKVKKTLSKNGKMEMTEKKIGSKTVVEYHYVNDNFVLLRLYKK